MAEKVKSDKVLQCPRDKSLMQETIVKSAYLDRCGKCQGTFFDQGEMFEALGKTADPSFWDRPGTSGAVRPGKLRCPRCKSDMLAQDLGEGVERVEIDRCGDCGGIWLDRGEEQKVMAVGGRQVDKILAERRAAQAELDKLGDVDFSSPGLLYRFLSLFKPQ